MQIITCAVIKGGTGKTATCASIAQCAAVDGKRVLIVDLDPQGTITTNHGASRTERGAAELLQGAPIEDTIQHTALNIDIIAGAPKLAACEVKDIYKLSKALEAVKKQYDLIVIDTPPYFCGLTYQALQAATGLIIPLYADPGSMQGQEYILELAKKIKTTNSKLKVLGSIITRYDNRPKINRFMREQIEKQGKAYKCPLLGEISQGVAYQEAAALKRNLFVYAPKSKPAQEYRAIYNKIIK